MSEGQGKGIRATKLVVRVPSYISERQRSTLVIVAVDEEGRVDRSRNDEVELTMTPMYNIESPKVKLDKNIVKLINGEATVGITNEESDFVKITASCKDKKAGLEPYTVLLATGGYPFGR
ncbi:MAG: hypothetical protein QXO25_00045 [Candidatus Bathyarchaeia archaeon]